MNSTEYLKLSWLLFAQLASFALTVVVYRKRKETGFLVLSIALGFQAAVGLFGVLARFGLAEAYMAVMKVSAVSWLILYGPTTCVLVGWALLAKKKDGA